MDSLGWFKLCTAVGLLLLTVIGVSPSSLLQSLTSIFSLPSLLVSSALLPLKLTNISEEKRTTILSYSSFFIGGVFLGAGLLHMLPDASAALSSHYGFPLVYGMAACGFLLIWGLDKLNFSNHQLDNSALLSMAVKKEGSTLCYVSVRPVVLTYGSFKNNRVQVIKQAGDQVKRLVEKKGGRVVEGKVKGGTGGEGEGQGSPHQLKEDWFSHAQGEGADTNGAQDVDMGDVDLSALSDDATIAIYPAVAVVPIKEVNEESKESAVDVNDTAHSSPHHRPQLALHTEGDSSPLLAHAEPSHEEESPHSHEELHHHHISIPAHALLPIFLALVFSVHSLIEGLALGTATMVGGSALSLVIAISSHKLIEAVSVGANFVREGVEMMTALPVLLIYTLMTPAGILLGWAIQSWIGSRGGEEEGEGVTWGVLFQSLCQAFASGSFLYLAIHEVSDEKCCARVPRWGQIALMIGGVGFMALLAVWV